MDDDDFRGKFPVIAPGSFEQSVTAAMLVGAVAKAMLAGVVLGLVCLGIAFTVHSNLFTVMVFGRAVMIGSVLSFGIFLTQARRF